VCSNQVQYSLLDRRAENVMLACPGPPGLLSALSDFPSKSVLYGGFVWARGALNGRKRRFPARAVAEEQRIVLHTYGAALLFHLTFHRLSLTLHLTFHCLFTAFRIGGWRAAVGQG
jgi:hypothetical protein